jgi:hypothetical protein
MRDHVSSETSLVVASRSTLSAAALNSRRDKIPVPLYGVQAAVASRFGQSLKGGSVYTDDRAPVEWLTDLSILRYAGGAR